MINSIFYKRVAK